MPHVFGHLILEATRKKLESIQHKFLRYVAFKLIVNEFFDTGLLHLLNLLPHKVRRLQILQFATW